MKSLKPDNYHVAVKTFIRKEDEILLCKDIANEWDLPGGRISADEFDLSLEKILQREIEEELGKNIQYQNHGIACVFRHKRPEITENKAEVKIFIVGFDVEYISGEITLSDEHNEYKWISIDIAEKYLESGQKDGLKKYREYLKQNKKRVIY